MNGIKLINKDYFPYRLGWDHDHCEFCGTKFSENEIDIKNGYTTEDGYRWICSNCFEDFKNEFNWIIEY